MELVNLKNLDRENTYFHFTSIKNIEDIEKSGLVPKIGGESKGVETTPKIYFSKGTDGVLKLWNTWLKYEMNAMFNEYGLIKKGYGGETLKKLTEEWHEEFLSKKYLNDEIKKKALFELMYKKMKTMVYLSLDLNEEDFSYDDIDEWKEKMSKQKGSYNYLCSKEMYGDYSNIDDLRVDDWNMQTRSNIETKRISKIASSNGKQDVISILTEMYDSRNTEINYDILGDFVKYIKEKEIQIVD